MSETERLVVHHRCGELALAPSDVIEIANIAGFSQLTRFALVEHADASPFAWLAALDDAAVAFAVTDPTLFFADYKPEWKPSQLAPIGAKSAADLAVLVVVTAREASLTANLAAPVVVDGRQRRGAQTILDGDWPVSEPIVGIRPGERRPAWRQIESKPHR
jgi:flagellar assembly factor FliW